MTTDVRSLDESTGLYSQLGVSAAKTDIHAAIHSLDKGLYTHPFCKIVGDLAGDDNFCTVMHSDGCGSKALLATQYWQETNDPAVWRVLAQDALAMNLNDMACVGACNNFIFNSTVNRNPAVITADALKHLINGIEHVAAELRTQNVSITGAGGETADLADIVSTITIDISVAARMPRAAVIDNSHIADGDVIIGLSSKGPGNTSSGIGSNGLTLARYVLSRMTGTDDAAMLRALLLSPTPVYTPVVAEILSLYGHNIHGMSHCTGGGQVKDLRCLGDKTVIKDNLFEPPLVFNMIARAIGNDWRQMYAVFNMGHMFEIFTPRKYARPILEICGRHDIEARIVGHVHDTPAGKRPTLTIDSAKGLFKYTL